MSTSLSLYDFINNVIVGFLLIIACFPLGFDFGDTSSLILVVMSYIIGLIYSKLNELSIGKLLRNDSTLMYKCFHEVENEFIIRKKQHINEEIYYKAYYKGWQKYCEQNIEILEAQLAFIRNLWPIIIIYLIGTFTQDCDFAKIATGHCCITLMPLIITFSLMVILHKCVDCTFIKTPCTYIIKRIENKCYVISFTVFALFVIFIFRRLLCSATDTYSLCSIMMNVSICELSLLCILLVIILPTIGYHIQKKIYKLVFEYDKYVSESRSY